MDRNYLKGSQGDASNAVLAAAGYNFRRLLACLRRFLRAWMKTMMQANNEPRSLIADCNRVLHGRLGSYLGNVGPVRPFLSSLVPSYGECVNSP
jgi:hypothetical protein